MTVSGRRFWTLARIVMGVVALVVPLTAPAQGVSALFLPGSIRQSEPSQLKITFRNFFRPQDQRVLFLSGSVPLGALTLFDPAQLGQPLPTNCSVDGDPFTSQGPGGLLLSVPFAALNPGEVCSISLQVTSTVFGYFPAPAPGLLLENASLGPDPAQLVVQQDVLEVADPPPRISLSRGTIDFGPYVVGSTSPAVEVTVSNEGIQPLAIGGIGSTGDFGFSTDCVGRQLGPLETCGIAVTFSPLQTGLRVGDISVESNDLVDPVARLALSGNGVPTPSPIQVTPFELTFPDTLVGDQSEPLAVTLVNLSASSVQLAGAASDSPSFVLQSNCPGALPPGGACNVLVSFRPQVDGRVAGQINFQTTPTDAANPVRLAGVGVPPPARLRLSPVRAEFPDQLVSTASEELQFQLRNVGNRVATVSRIYTTGDFSITSRGLCEQLAAGSSCAIGVRFTPTQPGNRSGVLVADVERSDQPVAAELFGLGQAVPTPRLELSATEVGFGRAWVGSRSIGSVTLRNAGTGPLTIGPVSTNPPFRVSSMGCPATLASREACVLGVAFEPTSLGTSRGSLMIGTDTVSGPRAVGLSGTACGLWITARGASINC